MNCRVSRQHMTRTFLCHDNSRVGLQRSILEALKRWSELQTSHPLIYINGTLSTNVIAMSRTAMLPESKLQLINYQNVDALHAILNVITTCDQPSLIVIENILQLVGSSYIDCNRLIIKIIKACDMLVLIGPPNSFLQLLMDEVVST